MEKVKRPGRTIGRGMMIVGILFTSVMCLFMATQSLVLLKGALYQRYDVHVKDVLTHIENGLDMEDLQRCIETGEPSEKYLALQQDINRMVDDFELLYIYIGIPTHLDDGRDVMINVISSTSSAERAAGDTEEYPIGYYDEEFYSEDELALYLAAWNRTDRFSSFTIKENRFESSYIVVKPLLDENGETFALLCADTSLDGMHKNVNTYIWASVSLIILICIAFSVAVGMWLNRAVSHPLAALEKSAHSFADKSREMQHLSQLSYEPPDIHTENEIQQLSEAITQMAGDMKSYAEEILSAEKRAETAEEEVEDISRIAFNDELTQVGSKVAYDARKAELAKQIDSGTAKFALVLVDINNLKRMNDTYGLENGDKYIIRAAQIISDVYRDIPVYRVEGDEFVVFLEGDAYRDREELLEVLEEQFRQAQNDMDRDLWERCTAAAGMTEFTPGADTDVEQVYRRAEKIMLRNKRVMKNDLG